MDDKLFPQSPGEASFVAIGDSFTEGLNDAAPGGGFRGWADRLAGLLAADYSGLRYANLAIRGKLLRQIVAEQVPAAAAMSPDLISIAGGGNDILRPGADPDVLAELFDAHDCYLVDLWSMRFLRSAGAWSPDRLHLSAQSHQRVSLRACEVLG